MNLEIIERIKRKNFEKDIMEKVIKEDLIKWSKGTDYIDKINEELHNKGVIK